MNLNLFLYGSIQYCFDEVIQIDATNFNLIDK